MSTENVSPPSEEHLVPRVLAACPLPIAVANELADWAREAFPNAPVRFIAPEQMRVTILFYPNVSTDERDRLASLMTKVEWNLLPVETADLIVTAQSAIAMNLKAPEAELSLLEDRLVRSALFYIVEPGVNMSEKWATMEREYIAYKNAPLGQMALALGIGEVGRKVRKQRQRKPIQLFVSVARAKRDYKPDMTDIQLPLIAFNLDRIALYESVLNPGGAEYTLISEPSHR